MDTANTFLWVAVAFQVVSVSFLFLAVIVRLFLGA